MPERRTIRSVENFLQNKRAENDPDYAEEFVWNQEEKKQLKVALALMLAAAGCASLFVAIMYPIAKEQEKERQRTCPTHPTAIECIETPTVSRATPTIPARSMNAVPFVIERIR